MGCRRMLVGHYRTVLTLIPLCTIVMWLMHSSAPTYKAPFPETRYSHNLVHNRVDEKRKIDQTFIEEGDEKHVIIKYISSNHVPGSGANSIRLVKLENHTFHLLIPSDLKNEKVHPFLFQYGTVTQKPWHEELPWRQKTEICGGSFTGYNNEFAISKNTIIDRNHCRGPKGGEDLDKVLLQSEAKEYYTFSKGFIRISNCDNISINYSFKNKNHMNSWWAAVDVAKTKEIEKLPRHKPFTLAITRYEFVNLYHTMTDFYNAYLMMVYFGIPPDETDILFIDGHPAGSLDLVWEQLFGNVLRIGHLQNNETVFSNFVWTMMSYNSPMNHHTLPNIPMVQEFRNFFLERYQIKNITRRLDCNNVHVLFIWRRDYLAHPRNPSGSVSRKIKNEEELVDALRSFKNVRITALQIDKLDMQKQLQLIANTDILIGMHGAGLSHTLFLPNHGGLIEFYPNYWSHSNIHFQSMAKWRKVHYLNWINHDPHNESPNHYTKIPKAIITTLANQMLQKMCQ